MARRERDFPQGHPMRRSPFDPRHGMDVGGDPMQRGGMGVGRLPSFPPPPRRHQHDPYPLFNNMPPQMHHHQDTAMDPYERHMMGMGRMDIDDPSDDSFAATIMRRRNNQMMGMGSNNSRVHPPAHRRPDHQHGISATYVATTSDSEGVTPQTRTDVYQTAWVVDASQVRADMMCCICNNIMHNPLTLGGCGHNCCARCLNDVQTGLPRAECPQCRNPIRGSFGFNSRMATEIDNLPARCPRCAFTGTLRQVHGHERAEHGPMANTNRAIEWLQGHLPPSTSPITPEMRAAAVRQMANPQVIEIFATMLGQARPDTQAPNGDESPASD